MGGLTESDNYEDRNVHNVNNVNMAVIVVSNLVILELNTQSSGVDTIKKRKYKQNLAGQIIHDDGSSTSGR